MTAEQGGSSERNTYGVDLSGGGSSSSPSEQNQAGRALTKQANAILSDATARVRFRFFAVIGAVSTLLVLLVCLMCVLNTFVKHVDSIGAHLWDLKDVSMTSVDQLQAASGPAIASSAPSQSASSVAGIASAKANARTVYLESGLKTIATAGVAITAVLVFASTVLSMALVRSSFTLKLASEEDNSNQKDREPTGMPWPPSVEIVKEAFDVATTALKGLTGGGSKGGA